MLFASLLASASSGVVPGVQEAQQALVAGAEPVEIVFLVTGGDKQRVDNARHVARHLTRPGEGPINFHLVSDKRWDGVDSWAKQYTLDAFPADALALHANFSKITHGPGSIYMWKPLLQWLLPVPRAMVLDADVLLVRPVHELWAEFERFGAKAAVGIAREQAPSYEKLGPEAGVNGGVQLLHLQRMREADGLYQRELRRCATGACGDIGYLGDQTFYSVLKEAKPELFHALPCGWNRQLSVHFWSHKDFERRHACEQTCGLVHGNQPAFKALMKEMQTEARPPTCAECEAKLSHAKFLHSSDKALAFSADTLLECCCASAAGALFHHR